VAVSNPRWLRRDAAFWLGAARGTTGAAIVERLARTDQDSRFREHLTFVLSLTGDHGIDTLIDLARNDAAANVRGQALFWLGQKAGERAVRALRTAVDNDPDHDVRVKAVFAISQLPKDESVPRLIELARTHRDPEVRKQAMFWLGQTGDPRAVEFFEAVLKK
jgi:HEAT repeat protein